MRGCVSELLGEHPDGTVTVWRCDVADLDDVRRFVAGVRGGRVAAARRGPQRRCDAAAAQRVAAGPRADDGAARPRPGGDDRGAPAGAGRGSAGDAGDLGRDVRTGAARRRSGVPPGRLLADHRLRAIKRAQVELLPAAARSAGRGSTCTPPTRAGRTPPACRSRCRGSGGSPRRCCATRPAARTRRCGWSAVQPAPAGPALWHDRRRRPTSLLRAYPPERGAAHGCGHGAARRPGSTERRRSESEQAAQRGDRPPQVGVDDRALRRRPGRRRAHGAR